MDNMPQVDLLAGCEHPKRKNRVFILVLSGVLVLGLLLLAWNIITCRQIRGLDIQKNKLACQLDITIKKLAYLKLEADELQTTQQLLKIHQAHLARIVFIMNDLNFIMNSGISIKRISYQIPYLSLFGSSYSEAKFLSLVRAISKKYPMNFQKHYVLNKTLPLTFVITLDLGKQNEHGRSTTNLSLF